MESSVRIQKNNSCSLRMEIATLAWLKKTLTKKLIALGIPEDCVGNPIFDFNVDMGASTSCLQGKVTIPIYLFVKFGQPTEIINQDRENTKFMKTKDPEHFLTPISVPPEENGLFVMEFFNGRTFHQILLDQSVPEDLKIDVANLVYTILFRIFESNIKDMTVSVHKTYFKRIYDRLEEKRRRDPEFTKYLFKPLVINGVEVANVYVLLKKLESFAEFLETKKATVEPYDCHPDNILVKLPDEIRFIDLVNLEREGDSSVSIGKNRHWLLGYIALRDIRDNQSINMKSYFNFQEYINRNGKLVINYDLRNRIPSIAIKVYGVFLKKVRDYSRHVHDDWWRERMLLGSARAWIGGITYHQNHELSIIMFCEGILEVVKCIKCIEIKLRRKSGVSI